MTSACSLTRIGFEKPKARMLPAISATWARASGCAHCARRDQPIKRPVFDLKSYVRFFGVRRLFHVSASAHCAVIGRPSP